MFYNFEEEEKKLLYEYKEAGDNYIDYYNNDRPHRTLNNKTPNEYENDFYNKSLVQMIE